MLSTTQSQNKKSEKDKKLKEDQDAKEFYMQGKPYKEKYNGERLSKVFAFILFLGRIRS